MFLTLIHSTGFHFTDKKTCFEPTESKSIKHILLVFAMLTLQVNTGEAVFSVVVKATVHILTLNTHTFCLESLLH